MTKRATVFCSGRCLSKNKMTRYARHLGGMAPLAPWLHLWLQEKNEKERTVLTWCFFQSQKARNNATLTKTAELRWKATLSVLDATFVVVKKFPANKDCLLKLCMVVKSASTIGVGAGKFLVVRRNFARILTTFPKKSNKSDRQKKEESSSCQFGRHFLQVKACWAPFLLKFSGSFRRFSESLPRFYGILAKSKLLGGAVAPLHPHLLHQCVGLLTTNKLFKISAGKFMNSYENNLLPPHFSH